MDNKYKEFNFPDDEPIFVIRGKDRLALGALRTYYNLCIGAGTDQKHLDGVQRAIGAFEDFRHDHRDRMKLPD